MTERRIRYKPIGTRRKLLLERIKLAIVLSITGCLLIAAETTVLSHIPIPLFGWSSASPSLGLLFCMAVGFLFDEREGGVTGLLCGWLSEATGSGHMMLLPLLYLLCGYMSATVGRRRLAHNLPSFAVFSIVGGGMRCLYLIGMEMLSGGGRSHPASEAMGGSWEEQPHVQGAVAARVQEGLEELFHLQGQEGQ